jgi:hypothetical protein
MGKYRGPKVEVRMLTVIPSIIAYLKERLPSLAEVTEDFFPPELPKGKAQLMLRSEPSQRDGDAYLDGTREQRSVIAFNARALQPLQAKELLEDVLDIVDIPAFVQFLNLGYGRVSNITQPMPISANVAGGGMYQCTIQLDYEED